MAQKRFDQYENLLIKKAGLAARYKMKTVSSVGDVNAYCRMQKEDFLNRDFGSVSISREQSFSGMGVIGGDGKTILVWSNKASAVQEFRL